MHGEIKFRAWGPNVKYMWPWEELKSVPVGSLNCGEKIIMQYTGLKDRNGVEIYEGDIVKIDSLSYGSFYATIEYLNGPCKFGASTWGNKAKQVAMPTNREWERPHKPCECDGAMYEAMSIFETGDTFAEKTEKVEVVGNIHEHPELLKEQS